jgi:hypothetical protein
MTGRSGVARTARLSKIPLYGKLRTSLGNFKTRLFCRKFPSFFADSGAIAYKNKSISV